MRKERHIRLVARRRELPVRHLITDFLRPHGTSTANEYITHTHTHTHRMIPDATQAACADDKVATAVQEFCQAIALTRGSRETAANRARRDATQERVT